MLEIYWMVLQGMGLVFILLPPAGLLPAALFGFLYRLQRRWIHLLAALSWLAYSAWESLLQYGGLCSGECNIRVDLLAIYPILLAVSLLSLGMLFFRSAGR